MPTHEAPERGAVEDDEEGEEARHGVVLATIVHHPFSVFAFSSFSRHFACRRTIADESIRW